MGFGSSSEGNQSRESVMAEIGDQERNIEGLSRKTFSIGLEFSVASTMAPAPASLSAATGWKPQDTPTGSTRGAGHGHVVARIADHDRVMGRDSRGPHGLMDHGRMGLRGRIIRRLDRGEDSVPFEAGRGCAPRRAVSCRSRCRAPRRAGPSAPRGTRRRRETAAPREPGPGAGRRRPPCRRPPDRRQAPSAPPAP